MPVLCQTKNKAKQKELSAAGTPLAQLWHSCTHGLRRWMARRVSILQQERSAEGVVSGADDGISMSYQIVCDEVIERAQLLLRLRPSDTEASQASLALARRSLIKTMGGGAGADGSSDAGDGEGESKGDATAPGGRGWAVLRRMMRAGTLETVKWRINALAEAGASTGAAAASWVDSLVFLQSSVAASEMELVLRHASRRAICRLYGLKVYQSILSGYAAQVLVTGATARVDAGRSIDTKLGLLISTLTESFRRLPVPPGQLFHHYIDHVRAGGQKAVAALSGTMRSILLTTVSMLKGPVESPTAAIRLLDSLRFEYMPHEAAFIKRSGMVEVVQQLARGDHPGEWACAVTPAIREAATLLFSALMMMAFHIGHSGRGGRGPALDEDADAELAAAEDGEVGASAEEVTGAARLNPLQTHMLELVMADLQECVTSLKPTADGAYAHVCLCSVSRHLGPALAHQPSCVCSCVYMAGVSPKNAAQLEQRAYHSLGRLATVANPPAATRENVQHPAFATTNATASVLASNSKLATLLLCAVRGSCRVRQLALRMVGGLLTLVTPESVTLTAEFLRAAGRGVAAGDATPGTTLPSVLLHVIGELQVGVLSDSGHSLGGEERAVLSTETVDLFRLLLNSSTWRACATDALDATLNGVAESWPDGVLALALADDPSGGAGGSATASQPVSKDLSLLYGRLAALDILCQAGDPSRIQVGSRVTVTSASGTDSGHVVAVGPSEHRGLRKEDALVMKHSVSPSVLVVVPLKSLSAKGARGITPDLSGLPLDRWVLPLCSKMLATTDDAPSLANMHGTFARLLVVPPARAPHLTLCYTRVREQHWCRRCCRRVCSGCWSRVQSEWKRPRVGSWTLACCRHLRASLPCLRPWIWGTRVLFVVCVPSRGHVVTVATPLLVLDSGNADANKLAMAAESTVLNINGSLLGEGCRASAVDEMDVAAEKKKWSAVFPGVDELADIESKPIRCGKDAHDFKEFEDHEVGRTDNVLVRCLAHSCTAWVVRVARL